MLAYLYISQGLLRQMRCSVDQDLFEFKDYLFKSSLYVCMCLIRIPLIQKKSANSFSNLTDTTTFQSQPYYYGIKIKVYNFTTVIYISMVVKLALKKRRNSIPSSRQLMGRVVSLIMSFICKIGLGFSFSFKLLVQS